MIKLAKLMRKKPGDKGFTLIELIIVIAILAALIAILAPQYLKYVDKSRKTADESTAAAILQAVQVAASDPDITVSSTSFKVTWSGSAGNAAGTTDPVTAGTITFAAGTGTGAAVPSTDYQSAVTSAIGTTPALKSTEHTGHTYIVTVTIDAGNVTANGAWS